MKTQKFERSRGRTTDNKDEVGTIQVRVVRVLPNGGNYKGNISRSFTIREAKVSEVFAAIEAALFDSEV